MENCYQLKSASRLKFKPMRASAVALGLFFTAASYAQCPDITTTAPTAGCAVGVGPSYITITPAPFTPNTYTWSVLSGSFAITSQGTSRSPVFNSTTGSIGTQTLTGKVQVVVTNTTSGCSTTMQLDVRKVGNSLSCQSFTLLGAPVVLPITGLKTSVQLLSGNPQITWSTQTEVNTKYFQIEKSINGTDFSSIGSVTASGGGSNYYFSDYAPSNNSVSYYRIKAVDVDGHFSYGEVVALRIDGNTPKSLRVFPNPVKKVLNIETVSSGNYLVELFSIDGRKVMSQKIQAASNLISLPVSDALTTGTYQLKVTDAKQASNIIKVVVE